MRLEVGLLGLSQSRLSSSERLRASLAPYRPEAPVPGWLRNRCMGGRDIFWPDAHRLADKARTAGSEVRLVEAPDGFRVQVAALWTPGARQAFAAVSDTVAGLR